MIKDLKKIFIITGIIFFGLVVWSCESPSDELGSQFFQNGVAQGTESSYDVVAYNIFNNDTIRVDRGKYGSLMASTYDTITLGAFKEPIFGQQKASFFTQLRLLAYNFDFGTNPVVDSVVLSIKPRYATDSVTTTTNSSYVYPDGNVDSKKVVNTYPVKKYGKTKIGGNATAFNLKVYEVSDFMGSYTDKLYSNKDFNVGTLLGSKTFDGTINAIQITKNSDNSSLWSTSDVGIRIPLDATFFQNKIIAKKGGPELADAATFIRYFKGLKIAVAENDGYLFRFNAGDISMVMYYKNDVTTNGTTTRTQNKFYFDLSPGNNVHFTQNQFDRSGSAVATSVPTIPNTSGDSKIYVQGMGGPGCGIKIPAATIQTLKDLFSQQKAGIISAKIRLYADTDTWQYNYKKPDYFLARQKNIVDGVDYSYQYLSEMWDYAAVGYTLTKYYNLTSNLASNPTYYDISITETLKKFVESATSDPTKFEDFTLNVGRYVYNTSGGLVGYTDASGGQLKYSQNYNTRSITPQRLVLVGTDTSNTRRAQLIVNYGKK